MDLYKPSLIKSKRAKIHDDYVLAEINHLCFVSKSFEAVLAIDVLEHLKKVDDISLIKNIEKIAKYAALVFTPNGFLPQSEYDGNILQIHQSGWTVAELKSLGFRVYGINGLKFLRKEEAENRFKPQILFDEVSAVSQKLANRFPSIAFQLLCVKKLETK